MVGRPRGNVVSSPDVGQESVARNQSAGELGGSSVPEGRRSSWLDGLVGWLTTHGERAGNVLVYSSAYLSFITMAQVAIVMALLELPANLAPVVGGLVTFAVYANDRLADVETDAITDPQQASFIRRHSERLFALAAVAYGIAVALSVLGGPLALSITLLPGVFWVLYASSWIPDVGIRVRRLKELFIVNTAVVALAWAVSLTFLPIAYTDATITPAVAVVFGYFFLGIFVNAEIPNINDMEGDRKIGVKTMPIVFGIPRTRQALYTIDLATMVVIGFAVAGHLLSISLAAVLLVGLVYSLFVTAFIGRTTQHRLLTIAAESEYIFVAVLLVVVKTGL